MFGHARTQVNYAHCAAGQVKTARTQDQRRRAGTGELLAKRKGRDARTVQKRNRSGTEAGFDFRFSKLE